MEIKFRPSQERLESLNSGIYRRSMQQDYDAMCRLLAHFLIGDDGRYMGEEPGLTLLDSMTIKEIGAAAESIQATLQDSAVPKASE